MERGRLHRLDDRLGSASPSARTTRSGARMRSPAGSSGTSRAPTSAATSSASRPPGRPSCASPTAWTSRPTRHIATFADPDDNYFQLMSPMPAEARLTEPTPTPRIDRPGIPAEYGTSKATEHVEWGRVEERLTRDRVSGSRPWAGRGRPRVRPIDELYLDGVLYVGGSPRALGPGGRGQSARLGPPRRARRGRHRRGRGRRPVHRRGRSSPGAWRRRRTRSSPNTG